jgi:hypothetical protein
MTAGKALQHRIAGIMTELVIDPLEMIDIQQQNSRNPDSD